MSTITRERAELKSFITGFLSDPMHDDQSAKSMTAEVFRIALASLEAEPLCRINATEIENLKRGIWSVVDIPSRHPTDIALYTAPPAPVVPDLKELEAILDWILMLPCPTPKATHFAKRLAVVIDTCRAAMLKTVRK